MQFQNHTPINLTLAQELACASRDGGVYSGCGHDTYTVWRGQAIHLVHEYSSGCEYNHRTDCACTYCGRWDTPADLIAWLLQQKPSWWTNELLTDLGHAGAPA
jgi:hypothetical protein